MHVAKAISDADRYPGKPAAWLGSEYEDLADAAIDAVYAALLEMELPEEAAEAGATAITSASLGMSAHRLVAREFRAVIRSLANQGGAK